MPGRFRVDDGGGLGDGVPVQQLVLAAVVVVVDGVEVALRPVMEHRGNPSVFGEGACGPAGDQRHCPHAPAAAGELAGRQSAGRPDGFVRGLGTTQPRVGWGWVTRSTWAP